MSEGYIKICSEMPRQNGMKKGPGGKPGPKALGNGGVSSREDDHTLAG
jgi:hypothetical protein